MPTRRVLKATAGQPVRIPIGERVTIVLGKSNPGVALVRLFGMLFPLNKAFVLPSAFEGIRLLKKINASMEGSQVLVVGHTDRSGSATRNRSLSLQRAAAVIQFLLDDNEAWLKYYTSETDFSRRWDDDEDIRMLAALPFGKPAHFGPHHEDNTYETALGRFQQANGLRASDVADADLRRVLIAQYMTANDTTLPASIVATPHGCGESFREIETRDGTAEPKNRRVEVFFFRDGIDPQPAGDISSPGSTDYPTWRERVEKEHVFRDRFVHRVIVDDPLHGLAVSETVELHYGDGSAEAVSTDAEGGLDVDAFRGDSVKIHFVKRSEPGDLLVFLNIPSVDTDAGVWQRLHNLGYTQVTNPAAEPDDPNEFLRAANNFAMEHGLEPGLRVDAGVRSAVRTAHDHDFRPWQNRFDVGRALPEEIEGMNDKDSVS